MNVKEAYNLWAEQYDTNKNHTRDLEAVLGAERVKIRFGCVNE